MQEKEKDQNFQINRTINKKCEFQFLLLYSIWWKLIVGSPEINLEHKIEKNQSGKSRINLSLYDRMFF